MVRDEKYSLISVNAGDDEEIVIQTGVSSAGVGADALDHHAEAIAPTPTDAPQVVPDPVGAKPAEASEEPRVAREPEVPRETREPEQRYRETTSEDLESVAPMSKMQKTVIACILFFIVAFAAYYVFLR